MDMFNRTPAPQSMPAQPAGGAKSGIMSSLFGAQPSQFGGFEVPQEEQRRIQMQAIQQAAIQMLGLNLQPHPAGGLFQDTGGQFRNAMQAMTGATGQGMEQFVQSAALSEERRRQAEHDARLDSAESRAQAEEGRQSELFPLEKSEQQARSDVAGITAQETKRDFDLSMKSRPSLLKTLGELRDAGAITPEEHDALATAPTSELRSAVAEAAGSARSKAEAGKAVEGLAGQLPPGAAEYIAAGGDTSLINAIFGRQEAGIRASAGLEAARIRAQATADAAAGKGTALTPPQVEKMINDRARAMVDEYAVDQVGAMKKARADAERDVYTQFRSALPPTHKGLADQLLGPEAAPAGPSPTGQVGGVTKDEAFTAAQSDLAAGTPRTEVEAKLSRMGWTLAELGL